jgi:hypothetical protein
LDTNLKVDPQFRALTPPLAPDEYEQLERNIVSVGACRDPIVTYDGYIIGGHARHEICLKHGIPFKTEEMSFRRRYEALLWIIGDQLGRRNLSDAMRIELAMRKTEMQRLQAKENMKTRSCGGTDGAAPGPVNMRKIIAGIAGVGEPKVRKYIKIRNMGGPELLEQVQKGEMKIGTAYNLMQAETTTVEELFSESDPDIAAMNKPLNKKAVQGNIANLAGLYKTMAENLPENDYSEQDDEVDAALKAQLRALLTLSE